MKHYLLILGLIMPFWVQCQSAEKGKLFIDTGGGLGVYHGFSIFSPPENAGINAAAFSGNLRINYFVKPTISTGIEIRHLVYPSNESDTNRVIASASGTGILLTAENVFFNRKKFHAFVGAGLGVYSFAYERYERDSTQTISENLGQIKARGTSIYLGTGFRWCFSKHLGLNFRAGYSIYPLRVNEYRFNGNVQEEMDYRKSTEVILNFRGVEGQLGLSVFF
ncbi:MAG TPA: hypothetical protein PK637_15965 [Flavobacteriales bacterium]|nr:hypothetical protein [Flavobacteriales bacterium]HRE98260.1 hypothetical protein [Flavobacteriales bacterium]HRJ38994.1 hypothetical protein [Flavobacteriales bacterium]